MNVKALPYILERDFPKGKTPTCLYCGRRLKMELIGDGSCGNDKPVLDHLDDDNKNNAYGNLALACQGCNQAKRTSPNLKLVARDKITENANKPPPPTRLPNSGNIRKSRIIYKAVEAALEREVDGAKTVLLRDFCRDVSYQLTSRHGFGNIATVRRDVGALCSRHAPWQITTDAKSRKVVSRRPER